MEANCCVGDDEYMREKLYALWLGWGIMWKFFWALFSVKDKIPHVESVQKKVETRYAGNTNGDEGTYVRTQGTETTCGLREI